MRAIFSLNIVRRKVMLITKGVMILSVKYLADPPSCVKNFDFAVWCYTYDYIAKRSGGSENKGAAS